MLRTILTNASHTSVRPAILTYRVIAPSLQLLARHQSAKANNKQALISAARKLNDKLQENWNSPTLAYEQLKPKTLTPSNDAYLIDVREPHEVSQGSIPSSVNLPLSVLASSLNLSAQAFRGQHGFDKPGKTQEVVFYCRSGQRSASACDIARRSGYENIINYEGSWLDWVSREADGPKVH